MYLYPNDLKGKPILWLWYMKDIVIIGIICLISIMFYTELGWSCGLIITAVYAILTLRLGDECILDFLGYSISFFLLQPQTFTWYKDVEIIQKERIES